MQRNTQLNWVKEQLTKYGKVSRNQALSIYFSRLGARIDDLRKEGWDIESKSIKEKGGTDFYYFLKTKPKQLKVIVENGIARKIYE